MTDEADNAVWIKVGARTYERTGRFCTWYDHTDLFHGVPRLLVGPICAALDEVVRLRRIEAAVKDFATAHRAKWAAINDPDLLGKSERLDALDAAVRNADRQADALLSIVPRRAT